METENIHIIDEAYGFKSGCYTQTREGIVFSVKCATGSESYILKPCLETADRKIFTYAIHSHLNQNGFFNTDRILKTSGDSIFYSTLRQNVYMLPLTARPSMLYGE